MSERIPISTAKLVVFRAYLASDGLSNATGKTIAITISKNGGAFGNPNAGATNATEMTSGFYKFTLDTTDTNTAGPLAWRGAESTITDAGDAYTISAATGGLLDVNVATFTAGAVTTAAFTAGAINAAAIADGAIDAATFAAGAITATVIADAAIDAATFAAGAINAAAIADGAIDEATYATTAGSFRPLGIIDQGTAQSATGTTVVLRSASAFADDVLIGATIEVYGSTQGYSQSRIITANALSTDTVTVETWTVTPSGTITYKIFATAPSLDSAVLDAAGVRAAVGLASANLDTQLGTIDTAVDTAALVTDDIATDTAAIIVTTDAILVDTAEIGAAGAGLSNINLPDQTMNITGNVTGNVSGSVGSVTGAVGSVTGAVGSVTGAVGSVTGNVGGNVTGSVGSVVGAVGSVTGNVGGSVASVASGGITAASFAANAITAAKLDPDVTTELQAGLATAAALAAVLAMLDDPRAEPGQGAPAVNADAMTKLDYLYKAFRNKITQSATELSIYADNGSTIDHKATVSDDATTFTRGEIATGA